MSVSGIARRYWSGTLGAAGTALDVVLAPAEAAYRGIMALRNGAYDRGLLRAAGVTLPAISVGNIAVGGSGKTPFTSWLVQHLAARGERPAIVHGGYALDEPALHRMWTPDVPVIVDRDRVRACARAAGEGATVVVLDDAFQHRRLRRDLDIVLVSVERWTPSLHLLPRGPWREASSALARAGIIACVRRTDAESGSSVAERLRLMTKRPVIRLHLDARRWIRNGAVTPPPTEPAVLVAALADPDLFAANARAAGAAVRTIMAYPDHHEYTAADVNRIRTAAGEGPVVTSAKDWVKLSAHMDAERCWVLVQDVVIEDGMETLETAVAGVLH